MFTRCTKSAGLEVARFVGQTTTGGSTPLPRRGPKRLIERMLAGRTVSTGVFCPSARMTALSCSILLKQGVKFERDVAFISCDHEEAFFAGPFLRPATIGLKCEAQGKAAVEQRLVRIRNPERDRMTHLLIEPVLLPGEPAPQEERLPRINPVPELRPAGLDAVVAASRHARSAHAAS